MTDAPRTEAQTETKDARRERNNGIIVASCVTFVAAMVGASYAAVPLYDLFCRVTGYNGTTQRVEQVSDTVLDRTIKVTFDANTGGGLPWSFKPVDRDVEMRIGETVQINYRVKNLADRPTTGQATFNVTPMQGGAYFNKVACFCFTETTLQPGEERDMPVVFFIAPAIVDQPETRDIKLMTLSYTFYPREPSKPVAEVKTGTEVKSKL